LSRTAGTAPVVLWIKDGSPSGLSYPTRISGDMHSAVVAFTDTPELFGGEIRILAAIDFKDGKVVRWIDYWDGRSFQPHVRVSSRINFDIFLIGISPCQSLREIA
jgi:hypothetical protein